MRTVNLIAKSDDYDSALGFVLAGSAAYDGYMASRDGMLIAHDVLEHCNGAAQIGPVWDELEAVGAAWFVRLQHGTTLRPNERFYHPPERHAASDLCYMFGEWDGSEGPYQREFKDMIDPEEFSLVLDEARRMINAEHGRDIWPTSENEFADSVDCFLRFALFRMRIGFEKASRRYRGDHWQAQREFVAIRDAVARAVGRIDYEGQRFRLRYCKDEAYCFAIEEN